MGRSKHSGPDRMRASERRAIALKKSADADKKRKPIDVIKQAGNLITKGPSTINKIKKRRARERELLEKYNK